MRAVAVIVEWRLGREPPVGEIVERGNAVLEFGGHLEPRIDHRDAHAASGPTSTVDAQRLPQDGRSHDRARRIGAIWKLQHSPDDVQ